RRADPDPGGSAFGTASQRSIAGLALLERQYLRIIEFIAQHPGEAAGVENHSGGDDRSGERSPPCLVDAAYQPLALPLYREIRHRPLHPSRLVPRVGRLGKNGVARGREIIILIGCRWYPCGSAVIARFGAAAELTRFLFSPSQPFAFTPRRPPSRSISSPRTKSPLNSLPRTASRWRTPRCT